MAISDSGSDGVSVKTERVFIVRQASGNIPDEDGAIWRDKIDPEAPSQRIADLPNGLRDCVDL